MSESRLSPLQQRVLRVLGAMSPPFALTGGAALVGFHLRHRTTRDLDLFWHGLAELGELDRHVEALLGRESLKVERLQRSPASAMLRISSGDETVVIDLVADPVPVIEEPVREELSGTSIQVDTPHEILVNKLCALLGRSEIRDLVDVKALLEAGGDFHRALRDAPRKDGGFSPLTLAHLLQGFPVARLAAGVGLSPDEARDVEKFRQKLVADLIAMTRPE